MTIRCPALPFLCALLTIAPTSHAEDTADAVRHLTGATNGTLARSLAVQTVVEKPVVSKVVAEIEATVVAISKPVLPAAVVPYRRAFLAHIFDVKKVISGRCDDKRILVAFWGLLDGKVLPCKLKVGETRTLRLVSQKSWAEAKAEKVVYDETDENDLLYPPYYEAGEIAVLDEAKK